MECPVGSPADLRADLQTISENPFGEDTVYWNAMCNILPVYECKPANGATLSASQLEACIQGLLNTNQVQGPYLCRCVSCTHSALCVPFTDIRIDFCKGFLQSITIQHRCVHWCFFSLNQLTLCPKHR